MILFQQRAPGRQVEGIYIDAERRDATFSKHGLWQAIAQLEVMQPQEVGAFHPVRAGLIVVGIGRRAQSRVGSCRAGIDTLIGVVGPGVLCHGEGIAIIYQGFRLRGSRGQEIDIRAEGAIEECGEVETIVADGGAKGIDPLGIWGFADSRYVGEIDLAVAIQVFVFQVAGLYGAGLDVQWMTSHRERLAVVTIDEVAAAAAEYLSPQRMIGVAVGDAEQITEPLSRVIEVAVPESERTS